MVASAVQQSLLPRSYLQLSRGYTAEYTERGSGPPLVLVPGLAGGIDLLEPLVEQLSRRYRVILYELRGEGYGLFERGYGFGQLVDDLEEVIAALQLECPGLVGFSLGGAIALEYAARHPGQLSFLAVQGTGKSYDPGVFGNVARAVLDRLPLPEDSPFINQFFNVLIGGGRTEGDAFDFIVDCWWQTDQSVMAYRMALLDEYDVEERLDAIGAPTLVLAGEHDVLTTPEQGRDLARRIPQAKFHTISGAGHMAAVTHAKEFATCLRRFDRVPQVA